MTKQELILENEHLKKLAYPKSGFVGSNNDAMVLLKLRDYSTEILARVRVDKDGFKQYYTETASGKCFVYSDFGVDWVKQLKTITSEVGI